MRQQYGGEESGCCQRGESLQDRSLRAQACQCRGGLNDAPGFSPIQIPSSSVLPSGGTQLYAGSAVRSRGGAHNLLLCVEGESVGIGCYGTGSLRPEAAFCSARGAGDSRSCRPTHGTPPPPSGCRTAAPDRDPVWLV